MKLVAAAGLVLSFVVLSSACKKSDDDAGGSSGGRINKVTEAELHLRELAKHAKRVFGESGAFPIGKSTTLPAAPPAQAAKGCCFGKSDGTKVDNKCAVTKDWAADPVWKALEFNVDEASNYRYTYESTDGKSFVATAVGDLDCDNEEGTYTLTGKLDAAGKPATEIAKPAANVF